VTLCRWHHRLLHEGGIQVRARPGGGWRFMKSDGEEFAPVRVDPLTYYRGTEIEQTHRAEGPVVTDTTAATRWRGERMDYDHGIMLLCLKAERAREEGVDGEVDDADTAPPDVSAETLDLGRSRHDDG
jgi:hypothetical protein